jgi:hypothetical protein
MSIAVLTPSYSPDFELCRDLNRSVMTWTPDDVEHHIVVPRRDRARFAALEGRRTKVWTVDELLPRRMVPVPGANAWVNARRPLPPVRGWVMQQVVKLQAATLLGTDIVLLADSDVVLVGAVTEATFRDGGRTRLYRRDGAVDHRLPRHLRWHAVARELLGLPAAPAPPLPDYISAFNVWERDVVLALRDRVEAVAGRPWLDAIAGRLHVSEFILYGVLVDEVLGPDARVAPVGSMRCHSYWDARPLAPAAAAGFVAARAADDVAVMLSAKSGTPLHVRRAALAGLRRPVPVPVPVLGGPDAQLR